MALQQKNRLPSNDFPFYNFSGGVNKRVSPVQLQPHELSDAQNVLPSLRGAIDRRYGFTKWNAVEVVASNPITGLLRFYRAAGSGHVLVAACGTKIMSASPTVGSTDLGATAGFLIDDGAPVYMVQHRDRVYGTAWGGSNHLMFVVAEDPNTGTALMAWPMGVTVPTFTPTTADTTGGTLSAGEAYYYSYSFLYGEAGAHGESNPGPTSAQHTVGAAKTGVIVTIFDGTDHDDYTDALDHGVDQVKIFRSRDAGTTMYYYDTITLADAATTTYTDLGAGDAASTVEPYVDHFPPEAAKYITMHNNRAVIGNLDDGSTKFPWRVAWSQALYPDVFPADNYVDLDAEHGAVMGVFVLNGRLFAAQESAITAIDIAFGSTYTTQVVDKTAGVKAPRSLVVGQDGHVPCAFFLSQDHKVYAFDGNAVRGISEDVHTILTDDANQSAMDTCAGGWDGEYYYLSYPHSTASVPDRELRYCTKVRKNDERLGYDVGTWWPQLYPTTATPGVYHQLAGGADNGALLWGNAQDTGWIFTANSGSSDNGDDLVSFWQTGYLNLGMPGIQKTAQKLLFDMGTFTALQMVWDVDFNRTAGQFLLPDSTETPRYDQGYQYDSGHFYVGDSPNRSERNFEDRTDFVWVRFKVSGSDSDSPYRVYGWTFRADMTRED